MAFQKIKDVLDWGKRIQFAYQAVVFLFSAGVVSAMKTVVIPLTHIPLAWHFPVYFFTFGLALLLFASVGRMLETQITSKQEQDTALLQEIKLAGGRAALLWHFSARAKDLIGDLDLVWHHWNNASEKLTHPLSASLDHVNPSLDNAWELLQERRDFLVTYSRHLKELKVACPYFTSDATIADYPSDLEYPQARINLVNHADKLDTLAQEAWDKYKT